MHGSLSFLVLGALVAGFGSRLAPGQAVLPAQKVQDLTIAGIQAKGKGDLELAERHLRQAVELARGLKTYDWLTRSEALKHLVNLYDYPRELPDAEGLLQERVEVIQAGAPADPELGNALFDLLSALTVWRRTDQALLAGLHAEAYYRGPCAQTFLKDRCDRKLANVEAMVGGALFLADRHDEAETWLKRATDRPDDVVTPELMLGALRAYAAILALRLDSESAVKLYQRALAFEKSHPVAAKNVGEWADEPTFQ